MTIDQLTGCRQRLLRELSESAGGRADAQHMNRLREEIALVERQLAARCIPSLTEVVEIPAIRMAR